MIGASNPMDRICLVAVGPSILGIMKSIKIASNNDEHDDEGRGQLGVVPGLTSPPPPVTAVVVTALAAAAARLCLIFSTATAPSSASSQI